MPEERPVVVMSGGNTVRPLAPALAQSYDIFCLDQGVADGMRAQGLPAAGPNQVGDNDLRMEAASEATLAAGSVATRREEILSRFKTMFIPTGYGDAAELLDGWFWGFLYESVVRMRIISKIMGRVVQKRKVVLGLVHEDITESTKWLCRYFQANGIPMLHIPHGNHGAVGPELGRDYRVDQTLNADFAAVAGTYMVDWLAERGVDRGRAFVTGQPDWEQWYSWDRSPQWGKGSLGLDWRQPVVAFASSWDLGGIVWDKTGFLERAYVEFLAAAKGLPGVQCVVSVHPNAQANANLTEGRFTAQWHVEVAKRANAPIAVVDVGLHAYQALLTGLDLLVVPGESNMATIAAILGKPTLSMTSAYTREPAVLKAGDDLPGAIREALSDGYRGKWAAMREGYLERHNKDGHRAKANIMELIGKIVAGEVKRPQEVRNAGDKG